LLRAQIDDLRSRGALLDPFVAVRATAPGTCADQSRREDGGASTYQETEAPLPPEQVTPLPAGEQLIVYVWCVTGLYTSTVAADPGAA
jgi:hypothetical protein